MISHPHEIDQIDRDAKRKLLTELLRQKASGTGQEFELSPGQEALLFLNELAPKAVAYNVAFSGRLRSEVNRERLEWSLLKLIERHPVLRSTFASSAQGPRQKIGAVPEHCLELVDATDWSEEQLHGNVQESYRRPFDLSAGPAFRATLFCKNTTDYVLLLVAHHIVLDSWSIGIILTELAALYESGQSASLAPATSYGEFVKWQRGIAQSEEGNESCKYWKSKLERSLLANALPTDHPRPINQSFSGASHHFELSAPLCAELRALARAQNTTPFTVLVAAFHALLHRYTGSSEIPIGTPLGGRTRREFEGTVGYFINPVVLSTPIEPNTSFLQHLSDMREAIIGAQSHGEFPFPELVKRLQPVRDNSKSPMFQVMLNMVKSSQIGVAGNLVHAGSGSPVRLGSLELEAFPMDQQEGQFDLELGLLDTGAAIPAVLKYNSDLFERETIERMAGHLVSLLSAGITNPNLQISELPLLTKAEETQLLLEWNHTARPYPNTTIHSQFEAQVERTPDAIAVTCNDTDFTYRELNERANQVAHYLRDRGVKTDVLVGICLERSIEMVVATLGVLKAGGAYLPLDPGFPKERLAIIVESAKTELLITQSELTSILPWGTATVVYMSDPELDAQSRENPDNEAKSSDLAYVIFTSGSTGRPKGVQIEHRSVVNFLESMAREPGLSAEDVLVAVTTLSFDIAGLELFLPLTRGARIVLASRETAVDGRSLAELLEDSDATVMQATPATWRLLLESGWTGRKSMKILCGGEALSSQLAAELIPRCSSLWNVYGPTETTIWSTIYQVTSPETPIPIGRPIDNTQLYVLDKELHPVPIGISGELFIAGDGVARGYLSRPDLTAERFIADPYGQTVGARMYRTGDLGRWKSNGTLECLGRNDYQIKIRGYRIELGDIEAALARHPQVKQAVVKLHERTPGDKRLMGYVVCDSAKPPQPEELRSYLLDQLPEYMVPADYMLLPKLPLTPNGKIDRNALPDLNESSAGEDKLWSPPENQPEQKIAEIWEALLNVPKVGRDSNFFDLGGHSLLMIRVRSKLEQTFGFEIAMTDLFRHSTVRTLAKHLSGAGANPQELLTRSVEQIQARKDSARQRLQRRQSGRL